MPQKKQNKDVELMREFIRSPFPFIEKMWGLVPVPASQTFIKGVHLTPDQVALLQKIEDAVAGKAKKRITVRAGHGVGKTTVLAMIIIWFLFTRKDAQIPCTAPTADQMHDVLWKEVAKWIRKMPQEIQDLFEIQTGYVRIKEAPETWFARAKTAKKEAPEALAGIHAEHVLFVVDEASGVPDEVFQVAEGALTEENILVLMISNPTRLIGYFYDSHHTDDAWERLHFSSANSPLVDNAYVQRIIDKHGSDSDEYRVRVLGEFPSSDAVDDKGFVPILIETDIHETEEGNFGNGKRLGIDPSGEGDDETVWVLRDRFKAQIIGREKTSTPKGIAERTVRFIEMHGIDPSNVYVDNFGEGANVAQELALLGKYVQGVNVGDKADDDTRYLNKRAESFWRVREWLKSGGMLVKNEGWRELLTIRYRSELSGKMKIMGKHDMKKLGFASPNIADALMLTFYRNEFNEPERRSIDTAFEMYD